MSMPMATSASATAAYGAVRSLQPPPAESEPKEVSTEQIQVRFGQVSRSRRPADGS